jgi:hypothetical protein
VSLAAFIPQIMALRTEVIARLSVRTMADF